ncbi:MAG TPA: lysophospholipid acyltransferase family protein [Thermoanaerobaculia bacterium]|jgi:1-acyl-sn-glycerol-3-phosphate acyltransferase|nr:lysophospholipid acyltransferase family protein [Thermoanaerobaculia bacterium]
MKALRGLRIVARAAGLIAVTLCLSPVHALGLGLTAGRPRARGRWRGRFLRTWSRAFLRVLGVRVAWRGPAPEPPFLLAANHVAYLDILVLASRLPTTFVAKAEIAGWPVLGPLCSSFGTLFVDRSKKSDLPRLLGRLEEALSAGCGVVFFPEGTSSPGVDVLPFRSPLLALPAASGHPVHAAALAYRTPPGEPPAHLSVCWWGDMPFGPHLLALLGHSRIEAIVSVAPEPLVDADRKALALALREAVRGQFEPSAPADFGFE